MIILGLKFKWNNMADLNQFDEQLKIVSSWWQTYCCIFQPHLNEMLPQKIFPEFYIGLVA